MYVPVHQTKKQINWPTHFMVHLHPWAGDDYTFVYGLSCWHGNPIQFTSPFAYLGLRMNNSSNRLNWRRYELNWTLYPQFFFLSLLNSVNFEISQYRAQKKAYFDYKIEGQEFVVCAELLSLMFVTCVTREGKCHLSRIPFFKWQISFVNNKL